MPANAEQTYLLQEKDAIYDTPSGFEQALPHESPLPFSTESSPETTKVYKRRWYILGVYSAAVFVAFFFFNTIPPIQGPVKLIFHWTDHNILILNMLSYVAIISAAVPLGWLTISKGLRPAMLLTACSLFIGKALQAIPYINTTVDGSLLFIGQFIFSLSFPICIGAPTFVSAFWFPQDERTTATAIGVYAISVGIGTSFLVGPAFVPFTHMEHNTINGSSLNSMKVQYKNLIYLETAMSFVVLFLVVAYFPSKPPLPPARSGLYADEHRKKSSYKNHLHSLMINKSFWYLTILFAIEYAASTNWLSILALVLSRFGISQQTASYMGVGATVSGVITGLLVSRFADYFNQNLKSLLIALFVGTIISTTVFSLVCDGNIPFNSTLLYLSGILINSFAVDGFPIFFELAVECTYPIPEILSTGFMNLLSAPISVILYVLFTVPHMNIRWMNWVVLASATLCCLGMLLYKPKYIRLQRE